MKNFERLIKISKIKRKIDSESRKYLYLKFLKKEILNHFFEQELTIFIPNQESSIYFRNVYAFNWKREYKKQNGIRYKKVYSHFSESKFEEVLNILNYKVLEKKCESEGITYKILIN